MVPFIRFFYTRVSLVKRGRVRLTSQLYKKKILSCLQLRPIVKKSNVSGFDRSVTRTPQEVGKCV